MNKISKPVMQAFLILSLLIIALPSISCVDFSPDDYVIDGDSITYKDSNVYFKVTPHTLTASGWVEVEFDTYKQLLSSADIVCGFDDSRLNLAKVQVWEEYEHTLYESVEVIKTGTFAPTEIISIKEIDKPEYANIGDIELNSNYASVNALVKYPIELDIPEPETIEAIIAYDKFDGKSFIYNYKTTEQKPYYSTFEDWRELNTSEEKIASLYKDVSYWSSRTSNISIIPNNLNKIRIWIDVPFKSSGKYNIGIKSSVTTLEEAKDNNMLWIIDPWYNASWDYRKEITVTDSSASGVVWIKVSKTDAATGEDVDCEGHCQDDFDDLRFTADDETTLLDYYIENIEASGGTYLATVAVEQPNPADSTLYMYYGNAGASSAASGADTFTLFDNFERGVNNDELGGSWTEVAGTCEISTEQAFTGTRSAKFVGGTSPQATIPLVASDNNAIRVRVYKEDATPFIPITTSDGTNRLLVRTNNNESIDYNDGSYHATGTSCVADAWFLLEVVNVDFAAGEFSIFYNGVIVATDPCDMQASATNEDVVRILGTSTAGADGWIDNFIVYKYCATTFAYGAEEEPTTPVVTTNDASLVEETTATTGGNITATGGENATRRGVQYDVDSGAPYASDSYEDGNFGTGSYDRNLTSLTKGELYYYRAYATNPVGTGYGAEKTFLTKPDEPSNFTATAVSGTQINLAWDKGTGADNTVIRGKQGSYPANIADGIEVYNNTGTSYSHSSLSGGEHWYYRAWSWCTEGGLEQYSDAYDEDNDTTLTVVLPTVVTHQCVGFDRTWAIPVGEVTDEGSANVTQYGFDYGLTEATVTDNSETAIGQYNAGDIFNLKLSNLNPATVYYYRAKAYSAHGWGYGNVERLATAGSPAIYEYYITGGSDNSTNIYGQNWAYQQFTSDNTTAHTVTSIRLYIKRTLAPGDITVSLRHATATIPTGLDLASAVVDGDTISDTYNWVEFAIPEYSLEASTNYAIVVRCLNGDAANYINWQINNAGGYANGLYGTSTNGGISWTDTADDAIFELWGNPCLDLEEVKVFTGYREEGDWLITARYINIYPPYYDTYDVQRLFVLQLASSDNVTATIAQTNIPAWGNRVGSIYLNANTVTSLDYGGAYSVLLYGTFAGHPYTQYNLEPEDWLGSDLSRLDSWVLSSAAVLSTYYDTIMTTYIAGRGECLNSTGGSIMSAGIPGIGIIRPSIFEIYTQSGDYNPETWNQSYRISLNNWQANVGVDTTAAMTRVGNLVGVSGNMIIVFLLVITMFGLAALAFPAGHTTAALALSVGFLFAGVGFGLDIIWIGVLTLMAAFLLVKQFWIDKGA